MRDGYTQTADLRMYWQLHGEAAHSTPLLLIHGGGETIEQCWGGMIPVLSRLHQVVAIEEEGHGRTRPTARALSSEASAEDIGFVLDDVQFETVDVIAFSAGCQTALALAMAHPGRVRRLVLCSAPWRRDAMIEGFWDGLLAGSPADMPIQFREEYLRLNPGDEEGFRRFWELDSQRMLNFRDWPDDAIRGIEHPTFVVAGDRDVVTVESAVRLATTLPNTRLLVLPAQHGDYLGQDAGLRDALVPLIERFLDS
jgi:pimeloyl-ACP methyl ester carboxylesterase